MLPQPTLLYDQPRAPNPRRVNLFLAEKGIDIPRAPIDLMAGQHKTAEYLGTVGAPVLPALVLDDSSVLTETQAICRYLEALHPEPNLMGRGPRESAEVEMWQRRVEFGLFAAITHAFRHTNPHMAVMETQVPDWGAVNRERIAGHLAALDVRLTGRTHIALDRPTIADITAIVALDFLRILKYAVPQDMAALTAYITDWHARPAYARIR